MTPAFQKQVLALPDQHRTMSLATLRPDGWPQATTVGLAHDGLHRSFDGGARATDLAGC